MIGAVNAVLVPLLAAWPATAIPVRATAFTVTAYDVELDIDRDRELVKGRERLTIRGDDDGLTTLVFPRNGIEVVSAATDAGRALRHVETDADIHIDLPAALARARATSVVVRYRTIAPRGIMFHGDAVYSTFDT